MTRARGPGRCELRRGERYARGCSTDAARLSAGDLPCEDRAQVLGGDYATVRRVDGRSAGVEQNLPARQHFVDVERHVGQLGTGDAGNPSALDGIAHERSAVVEQQRDVARAVTGRVDDATGQPVLVESCAVVECDDAADAAQSDARQRVLRDELVDLE